MYILSNTQNCFTAHFFFLDFTLPRNNRFHSFAIYIFRLCAHTLDYASTICAKNRKSQNGRYSASLNDQEESYAVQKFKGHTGTHCKKNGCYNLFQIIENRVLVKKKKNVRT